MKKLQSIRSIPWNVVTVSDARKEAVPYVGEGDSRR